LANQSIGKSIASANQIVGKSIASFKGLCSRLYKGRSFNGGGSRQGHSKAVDQSKGSESKHWQINSIRKSIASFIGIVQRALFKGQPFRGSKSRHGASGDSTAGGRASGGFASGGGASGGGAVAGGVADGSAGDGGNCRAMSNRGATWKGSSKALH